MSVVIIIEFYVRPKFWPDWGTLIFYSEIAGAFAGAYIARLGRSVWDRK